MKFNKGHIKLAVFVIVFGLTAVGLVAFFVFGKYKATLRGYYAANLHPSGGREAYDVSNGEIIREKGHFITPMVAWKTFAFASFDATETEDPLFLSTGFELNKYESSLNYLEAENNELKKNVSYEEDIVPIKFLKSLLGVHRAQSEYMKTKNMENALDVLDAYDFAVSEYEKEVSRMQGAIERDHKNNLKIEVTSMASYFTPEIALTDLGLIRKNATSLKSEIRRRRRILAGASFYRTTPKTIANVKQNETPTLNILSNTELGFNDENIKNVTGPYIMSTNCYLKADQVKPFFLMERESNKVLSFVPKVGDESYFQKLDAKIPTENEYLKKGYKYHFIHDGNNYRCNDLEFQARMITIDQFLKSSERTLLLGKLAKDYGADLNISSEDMNLERKFLSGENIGDVELSSLISLYYDIYMKQKLKGGLSESERDDQAFLLERYKYLSSSSVSLNEHFASSLFLSNLNARYGRGYIKMSDNFKRFLILYRSSYSLTFLNFSPSVWRLAEKPTYLKHRDSSVTKSVSPYATLTELKKKHPMKEIMSWFEISEGDIVAGS